MRKFVLVSVFTALASALAPAQQVPRATPRSSFAFTQDAADLQEIASFYTFRVFLDGSATGVALSVTCAGVASPFACLAPIPPLSPGTHSAVVVASNDAGDSDRSDAHIFRWVVAPGKPTNFRTVP